MTKLRATITETTATDLLLEAPDDMTLDEVKQAAADGELLNSCDVLEESGTDTTKIEQTVYAYGDQEVNNKVLPRVWLVIQHQSSDPEYDGRTAGQRRNRGYQRHGGHAGRARGADLRLQK